jgi:hypothetical protein
MIHDEALKSALTGQIMSAELAQHLKSCEACQAELACLKGLEAGLSRAGQTLPDPAWEEALARRLCTGAVPPLFSGFLIREWAPVAASTLLVAGLLVAWMTLGPAARKPAEPAVLSGPKAGYSVPAAQGGGWVLSGADEDSTATLLQTCESYGKKVPQSPSEEMEPYLLPHDTGGWDG